MPSDKSGKNSGPNQQTGDRQPADEGPRETESSSSHTNSVHSVPDKVVLTEMAAHLKSLEQKLGTQPEIDQAHVDYIRAAISRGEYRINPERVAGKMVDFESDF